MADGTLSQKFIHRYASMHHSLAAWQSSISSRSSRRQLRSSRLRFARGGCHAPTALKSSAGFGLSEPQPAAVSNQPRLLPQECSPKAPRTSRMHTYIQTYSLAAATTRSGGPAVFKHSTVQYHAVPSTPVVPSLTMCNKQCRLLDSTAGAPKVQNQHSQPGMHSQSPSRADQPPVHKVADSHALPTREGVNNTFCSTTHTQQHSTHLTSTGALFET